MNLLNFGLAGKVCLVAGGGQGMGKSCVLALAEAGVKVACVDLDERRARNVADEALAAGGEVFPLAANVCKQAEIERSLKAIVAHWGPIDLCVDNVGTPSRGPLLEQTEEQFDQMVDICLRHQFLLARDVARHMSELRRTGAYVSISSISGNTAAPFHGLYGAMKAAVSALVKTLAFELGPLGIRVNAVAPGCIGGPRYLIDHDDALLRAREAIIPLRRIGTGDDVAKVVVFLLSDLASYVSGQIINVDGGVSVRLPVPMAGELN